MQRTGIQKWRWVAAVAVTLLPTRAWAGHDETDFWLFLIIPLLLVGSILAAICFVLVSLFTRKPRMEARQELQSAINWLSERGFRTMAARFLGDQRFQRSYAGRAVVVSLKLGLQVEVLGLSLATDQRRVEEATKQLNALGEFWLTEEYAFGYLGAIETTSQALAGW